MPDPRDDSLMSRFERSGLQRFRAREGVLAILLAAVLLLFAEGPSVKKAGEEMRPGIGRDLVLAVGDPGNSLARALPLHGAANAATGWLNPEPNLSGGGFANPRSLAAGGQIPAVTPAAFTPEALGEPPPKRKPLRTLLITGDSMSEPLDHDLAGALVNYPVKVVQDPHIGTGISTTFVVNWAKLAASQVRSDHPSAVVLFIGANDGFPMEGPGGHEVGCCSAEWATIYADRARQIIATYLAAGARVYWMTLPAPRDPARATIARVVNAAIEVAAQPWASSVRIVDTVPMFTPGFVYRDAMSVGGKQTIVREADGVHLNEAGSQLLARAVLGELKQNFEY
jgi:lysophospholipase L1-like esterase